ncbi:MAG: hypothetical protein N2246_11470, partial [Candidatus Sumerlaeia bacterium]|nr:hypothetical protein [Candidatus Sumerlaeia bacterium]
QYSFPDEREIYGVKRYYTRVNLRCRLLVAKTGQIYADKYETIEYMSSSPENAIKEAISKLFSEDNKTELESRPEKINEKILYRLVFHWSQDIDHLVKLLMKFSGVSAREVNQFLHNLKGIKEPGVWIKAINPEEIIDVGVSTVWILGQGISTDWVADKLEKVAGDKLKVQVRTADSIEIVPLGYKSLETEQVKQITKEEEQIKQHFPKTTLFNRLGRTFKSWEIGILGGAIIIPLIIIISYVFIIHRNFLKRR